MGLLLLALGASLVLIVVVSESGNSSSHSAPQSRAAGSIAAASGPTGVPPGPPTTRSDVGIFDPTAEPAATPTPVPPTVAPVVPTATSRPAPTATPPTAKLGQSVQEGNWTVVVDRIAVSSRGIGYTSRPTLPQGKFVILQITAHNLHNRTSVLNTWDFELSSDWTGNKYETSDDGMWAFIDQAQYWKMAKPLGLADQIQPGLSRAFSLVFDVSPSEGAYYTLVFGSARMAISLYSAS
jgi:hypothetical protein